MEIVIRTYILTGVQGIVSPIVSLFQKCRRLCMSSENQAKGHCDNTSGHRSK